MIRQGLTATLWVCVLALGAAPPAAGAPETPAGAVAVTALPASLSGTWEIAFGDPSNGPPGLDTLRFRPVRVPATWQSQSAGRPELEQYGVAWYRLRVDLSPSLADTPLAFSSDQIRDADEVYFDGALIGR